MGTSGPPLTGGALVCKRGPPMRTTGDVRPADLVSVRAASARTGVPVRRLYKWIQREKIWSIRVGDRIMLHDDDVTMLEMSKAS